MHFFYCIRKILYSFDTAIFVKAIFLFLLKSLSIKFTTTYFAKKQAKKGFHKNWHSKQTILSHILPVFYSSATTSSSGFIALECKITPSENQSTITMGQNNCWMSILINIFKSRYLLPFFYTSATTSSSSFEAIQCYHNWTKHFLKEHSFFLIHLSFS